MITALKHRLDNLTDINKTIRSVTLYTWVTAGACFACYLYFVGAITFSVIKERALQQDTKTLVSNMGQAELSYLTLQKSLTKDYAARAGFIVQPVVSFAVPQKAFAWNVGR